jgi:hypothetical protein
LSDHRVVPHGKQQVDGAIETSGLSALANLHSLKPAVPNRAADGAERQAFIGTAL